jgi:hypothetical protein
MDLWTTIDFDLPSDKLPAELGAIAISSHKFLIFGGNIHGINNDKTYFDY